MNNIWLRNKIAASAYCGYDGLPYGFHKVNKIYTPAAVGQITSRSNTIQGCVIDTGYVPTDNWASMRIGYAAYDTNQRRLCGLNIVTNSVIDYMYVNSSNNLSWGWGNVGSPTWKSTGYEVTANQKMVLISNHYNRKCGYIVIGSGQSTYTYTTAITRPTSSIDSSQSIMIGNIHDSSGQWYIPFHGEINSLAVLWNKDHSSVGGYEMYLRPVEKWGIGYLYDIYSKEVFKSIGNYDFLPGNRVNDWNNFSVAW